MSKRWNDTGSKLPIILIFGALVHGAYADGYRNPPPTAEGIAKSGANMAFVDDASAISYNPANLSLQTNKSFVVGAAIAQLQTKYTHPILGGYESDDPWQPLPSVYFSTPLGDQGTAVGIGISTPYGQGLAWNASDFSSFIPSPPPPTAGPVPYEASMALINFNPTVSTMLGDKVALGVGLDIMYSAVELKALIPNAPPLDSKGEGDGWGFGSNIGLTWLPTERQRVAFTYRSKVDIDYKGDFTVEGADYGAFGTTINLPNSIGLGYGVQVSESIQIEALIEWLEWSSNKTQPLDAGVYGSNPQENNWNDTVTMGVGGSWRLTDVFAFHAGYSFIETPVPDEAITPLLPDADRHVIGLGLGYTVAGHALDISYAFSIYEARTRPAGAPGDPSGDYDIDSNLVGLTYSYSF
ncbi:MAG: outer membrane protein transport protein [Verrucomicrobiota bacterium]